MPDGWDARAVRVFTIINDLLATDDTYTTQEIAFAHLRAHGVLCFESKTKAASDPY